MIFGGKVGIAGFKFERIDGKRILQTVYLLNTSNGSCMPASISDDFNINKEELAKELANLFCTEVDVVLDIQNDYESKYAGSVIVNFVRVKSVNDKDL